VPDAMGVGRGNYYIVVVVIWTGIFHGSIIGLGHATAGRVAGNAGSVAAGCLGSGWGICYLQT